jgi:hypothetical protein
MAGLARLYHHMTAAQVQSLTTTAQRLSQHFQPVCASAASHVLQPSLQLTGWQHDMHLRAATTIID